MNAMNYELKDLKPNEAQFIMDAISNVPAPLIVSGPIYTKIQAQIEAQNAAFIAAKGQKNEAAPVAKTTKVKPKQ